MITARHVSIGIALTAATLVLSAVASRPAAAGEALVPIDLRQVHVGGEIGRRIDVTVNNHLLKIDLEKTFLKPFRAKKVETVCGLLCIGKLIDATVRLAAYTNDAKVIALKKHLIDEVIKTQEPDGYIGSKEPAVRMVQCWDIHEAAFIIHGLASDYHYFGEKRSLEAARKLADYLIARWPSLPPTIEQANGMAIHMISCGLESGMLTLGNESKESRYLDFCTGPRALADWNLGIIVGRRPICENHAYSHLARCLAQLDLYRIRPDDKLLKRSREAVDFMAAKDGMNIVGAASVWEIWNDDQEGRGATGETCTTTYQIRVEEGLLRIEGNPGYGDIMERTIYNALFAAQSPDGRNIRYFTPFEGQRHYFGLDVMCCPGNYRRIMADLPTMIYYRAGDGVAVNLYTASNAAIPLGGGASLKIRQETDYPTSGHVVIRLDPSQPARFPLQLRIPSWCQKATAAINGQPWKEPIAPGTFLVLNRQWKAGDQVTLEMPMSWRMVCGRKCQSGHAAVMRGPLVFCMNPAQNKPIQGLGVAGDAADLKASLTVDPKSLKDAPGGDSVRPGGLACSIRVAAGYGSPESGDQWMKLTEFADPDGTCTYFQVPDLSKTAQDELIGCPKRRPW